MTWVYEQYLFHSWVFWPMTVLWAGKAGMKSLYHMLAWIPLKLRELAYRDPAELLEWVSALSAILLVCADAFHVMITWKIQAAAVGLFQICMLGRRGREGRFVAMITATVFWWTFMLGMLPRTMTGYHVFLVPLCIAYIVTTYALLHDTRK